MARANRHYLPGHVWHITHRCHRKEFLLKFAQDRRRWVHWLREAKKRYGLPVLDYMVTSNHVHLLVVDDGDRDVIPRSLQLVAGRTAQEYNQRKNRNGAFWEDRYHATAVACDRHLMACIAYIDLNMVRAGAVAHPSKWAFGGYNEIRNPGTRRALIDHPRLMALLQIRSVTELVLSHTRWVEDALKRGDRAREDRWTRSIAVGDGDFVADVRAKLGIRARGRVAAAAEGTHFLREAQAPYTPDFDPENAETGAENTYFWGDIE